MAPPSAPAPTARKLSHRQHVLQRPGMYMGSVVPAPCDAWVMDEDAQRMTLRQGLQYVAALNKLLDEVLMNALDHAQRQRAAAVAARDGTSPQHAVHPVRRIDVVIERDTGVIEVTNDGDGVPVVRTAAGGGDGEEAGADEEGCYVPEMVFGQLLTSTNYDDTEQRMVGGTNGLGVKIANIMSRWFEVRTTDAHRRLTYTQRFEDNMSVTRPPVIKPAPQRARPAGTTVRFLPDYARLGQPGGKLTDDMYAMLVKRVYDATAVTGELDVTVWLNGKKLEVRSFERYVDLYLGARGEAARVYERMCDGWEVAVGVAEDGAGLQQVSFVNGVPTLRGGKHVEHVVGHICKRLAEHISATASRSRGGGGGGAGKKDSDAASVSSSGGKGGGKGGAGGGKAATVTVRPQYVRDNIFVFLRASVPNPVFDSQSKETLTTPVTAFGVRPEVSDRFIEKLAKLEGLAARVVGLSEVAAGKSARKTDGTKRATLYGIPKLDDAEWAGTAKSPQCTLILTEGDSAKASAVAGLAVVGRQRYGVFPLRGKVMNVRDVSADRVAANAEIAALKKILGLQTGKAYKDASELRYGRVMLMTDADVDGSHIRGLVMNLFAQEWPSLLRIPGFLCAMLTPVVKSVNTRTQVRQEFLTMADFEAWQARLPEAERNAWHSKHFKGLGTSTPEEARDWFRRMRVTVYGWQEDGASANALSLAFDKRRADDRKAWLARGAPAAVAATDEERMEDVAGDAAGPLATTKPVVGGSAGAGTAAASDEHHVDVTYADFVARDLIHFSTYDVLRSIPSAVDGLKVSQRKALFGCFKRGLTGNAEVRVAQLAAYVSEHSCFHHGEASMQGTIIGMAQDFVGSNNVPLLQPIGQFGSRLSGGSDAASPRYIHTRLARLTRFLFPKEDDAILAYLSDDGTPVQPTHYLPVLPFVLVNGAVGIGTGYSTSVPCYHPLDVAAAVRFFLLRAHVADDAHIAEDAHVPAVEEAKIKVEEKGVEDDGGADARAPNGSSSPCTDAQADGGGNAAVVSGLQDELAALRVSDDGRAAAAPNGLVAGSGGRCPLLRPWYRGFRGVIEARGAGPAAPLISRGILRREGPTQVRILELALGMWTDDFKTALEEVVEKHPDIKGYTSASFDATVDFTVTFASEAAADAWMAPPADNDDGAGSAIRYGTRLEAELRLASPKGLGTTNMHLFDADGRIRRYDGPEDIVRAFVPVRLAGYEARKQALLAGLRKEISVLANRVRFLDAVITGELQLQRAEGDAELEQELEGRSFDRDAESGTYKYLTGMPLHSLTRARKAAMEAELAGKRARLDELERTPATSLWLADLDAFEAEYKAVYGADDRGTPGTVAVPLPPPVTSGPGAKKARAPSAAASSAGAGRGAGAKRKSPASATAPKGTGGGGGKTAGRGGGAGAAGKAAGNKRTKA